MLVRRTSLALFFYYLSASLAFAGQAPARPRTADRAPAPPPVFPATISRTPEGAVTVRAFRLMEPILFDGRLDEPIYEQVPPWNEFIQMEPVEGAPASEATDAWVFFDNRNLYVSVRCWDSHPERAVANEMRRDGSNIFQNESVTVVFDTFHDKRNAMFFQTNLLGGLRDALVTDERDQNTDWNGVWDVRTAKFERGWTLEMVIPFKTLRYRPGPEPTWGVNIRRIVRWKNEWSFLTPMPAFLRNAGSINAMSYAAILVGLEVPQLGKNLDIKPYGIAGLRTDRNARPAVSNDGDGDFGVDLKYGVTKGLTLDLTYNTDFAQVEDDTQQVNLTRFNLFYPEQREFFLEGRGTFGFGGAATSGGGSSNTPLLFFSRRIGLNQIGNTALPVPIVAGGRLTGKVGDYSIGLLNIQSGDDAATAARDTNFTVLRVKRDLLTRSNVGVIYTRRAETGEGGAGAGQTIGIDGLFAPTPTLSINTFFAKTDTPGLSGDDTSHLARFTYNTDRYGLGLEHLGVGANFNPQVGFLRRSDFQRSFAEARFSPRPARTHMRAIRRFVYQSSFEYIENGRNEREWREIFGGFGIELQSSDSLAVDYTADYELIPKPFAIASGVTVPVGGYTSQNGRIAYQLGNQHALAGTVSFQAGSLYGGTKRTLALSSGRLEVSAHLALEPTISANWVDLPDGSFTSTVIANRTTLTFTPRMFVSALVQHNSSSRTLSSNARFRWEYRPGSELFVVYSDGRDTRFDGFPQLTNRAFIVKATRLLRF
jgi:hypothetical protein